MARPTGGRARLAIGVVVALIAGACGSPVPASPAPSSARSLVASTGVSPTASPEPARSSSSPPSPSAPPPTAPAAAIGDRVLVADRQYMTVARAEEWRGRDAAGANRYVSVLVELEGVESAPYAPSLFAVDTGTDRKSAAGTGRRPRFASSRGLRSGDTYSGWLTFSLPTVCLCELLYSLPIGQGQRSEPVRVLLDPIGPPTRDPDATPRPTRKPGGAVDLAGITDSFFGPDVELETFDVTGRSRREIETSILESGPQLPWLRGTAAAVTEARPVLHFRLTGVGDRCDVVETGEPAVEFEISVTLPGWVRPADAPAATVTWWRDEVRRIAVHERTHVEIYRDGEESLDAAVRGSECSNLRARVREAWDEIAREQCEFDMREYGTAAGLSIEECLSGAG